MYKLKMLLDKAKLTQAELGDALGIKSLSTINLKLNGKADFTTNEAQIIKKIINEKLNANYSLEDLFDEEQEEQKDLL